MLRAPVTLRHAGGLLRAHPGGPERYAEPELERRTLRCGSSS